MKLIALDTSLVELESNMDFTRAKDLRDIQVLVEKLEMTVEDAIEENADYIINENTQAAVELFIENKGDIEKTVAGLKEHMEYGEYMRLKEKYEPGRSLLDERGVSGMLDDLFEH